MIKITLMNLVSLAILVTAIVIYFATNLPYYYTTGLCLVAFVFAISAGYKHFRLNKKIEDYFE